MPGAVWLWSALGCYGIAGLLSLSFLLGRKEELSRAANLVLTVAFSLHLFEIGAHGIAGMHPVTSVREAIGFLAWLLVGAYLLALLRFRISAVGAFVAPAAIVLLLVARLSPDGGPSGPGGLGMLGRIHISLATAGLSLFALAAVLAVWYLVEERQLKQKAIGAFVKKGIALETLDGLVHRLVQVGFPLFTVAMITGAVWGARRAEVLRPEYAVALMAWASFFALLLLRKAGWRGRRAAVMTLLGFSSTLVVLGIYLMRRAAGG